MELQRRNEERNDRYDQGMEKEEMKRFIKDFVIVIALSLMFVAVLFGAFLQSSYKLNPPTEAERAEHPILIAFLAGGDE